MSTATPPAAPAQQANNPKGIVASRIAQCALSFVGAAVAGKLWIIHKTNDTGACSTGGCDIVAQSQWGHVHLGSLGSVDLALVGFIAYIVLLGFNMFKLVLDSPRSLRLAAGFTLLMTTGGIIYSWYLQYVAHFVIGAFCPWCFASACIMTVLFLANLMEWRLSAALRADSASA